MDGQLAQRLQEDGALTAVNNYADYDEFMGNLARYDAATRAKVHVHKGWLEQTLASFRPNRPISVLRLDCDWYESTILLLETLYDQVADHGLIIIDDYLAWEGCSRGVHQFLAKRQSSERLQQTGPEGVCYIIKNFRHIKSISKKHSSGSRLKNY